MKDIFRIIFFITVMMILVSCGNTEVKSTTASENSESGAVEINQVDGTGESNITETKETNSAAADNNNKSSDTSETVSKEEESSVSSVLDILSFYCWDGITQYDSTINQTEGYKSLIIYLNPIDLGQNRFSFNADTLQRKGSEVWYLMSGHPSLGFIKNQIDMIASYNSIHNKNIIGMNIDIEPWASFFDQNSSDNKKVWQDYLDMLKYTAILLHGKDMKLSVSIPFWLDKISQAYPNGRPLNQEIIDISDEVVVMDYTTYADRIYPYAKSTLVYADAKGKNVKIALELSDIKDDKVSFFTHPEEIRIILKTLIGHDSFKGYVIHAMKNFVISNVYL